jgi:hypothetical protein
MVHLANESIKRYHAPRERLVDSGSVIRRRPNRTLSSE